MGTTRRARAQREKNQGREIASFACLSRLESLNRVVLPGALGILAFVSNLDDPSIILPVLVIIGVICVFIPLLASLLPRTPSVCTIMEGGIRIKPKKPASARPRFLAWGDIARFSAKPMGIKGGRIYLYPKGPFSIYRREAIEPLEMSNYQLLFNYVSTRVGFF